MNALSITLLILIVIEAIIIIALTSQSYHKWKISYSSWSPAPGYYEVTTVVEKNGREIQKFHVKNVKTEDVIPTIKYQYKDAKAAIEQYKKLK